MKDSISKKIAFLGLGTLSRSGTSSPRSTKRQRSRTDDAHAAMTGESGCMPRLHLRLCTLIGVPLNNSTMILTGPAIKTAVSAGRVLLEPFDQGNLNPNSYNYHLADTLLAPGVSGKRLRKITLPHDGYVLIPGRVYLGTTHERIGSDHFVTLLLGRSSVGRLGVFLNVTADLGHIGSCSHWTLELTVIQPVRVYPRMKIGQVSFWLTDQSGSHRYEGRYHQDSIPVANRDRKLTRKLQ